MVVNRAASGKRKLLPHREETFVGHHYGGGRADVPIFQRFERGSKRFFVRRTERLAHGNPFLRLHSSEVLNLLHDSLPDVFPRAIEIRSLKFDEHGRSVMESPNIAAYDFNDEFTIKMYIKNLADAGFEFDNCPDDFGVAWGKGRNVLVLFEVYSVDFKRLSLFLQRLGGKEKKLIKPVWKRIRQNMDATLDDLVKKTLPSIGFPDIYGLTRIFRGLPRGKVIKLLVRHGLESEGKFMRQKAAYLLSELQDKSALPVLENALTRETDAETRRRIQADIRQLKFMLKRTASEEHD